VITWLEDPMTEHEPLLAAAWDELEKSIVLYHGEPVGTVAARDPDVDALNYIQVFTRDFAVSAVAFLVRGETEIVRNFVTTLVELQARDKHLDCFRPGKGLMPASFAVEKQGSEEVLVPDFGGPRATHPRRPAAASRHRAPRSPDLSPAAPSLAGFPASERDLSVQGRGIRPGDHQYTEHLSGLDPGMDHDLATLQRRVFRRKRGARAHGFPLFRTGQPDGRHDGAGDAVACRALHPRGKRGGSRLRIEAGG
jgi:hypothetical protein